MPCEHMLTPSLGPYTEASGSIGVGQILMFSAQMPASSKGVDNMASPDFEGAGCMLGHGMHHLEALGGIPAKNIK